ncbi:MAG: hypothetical protein ABW321_18615 [Polyangiales bacterium]
MRTVRWVRVERMDAVAASSGGARAVTGMGGDRVRDGIRLRRGLETVVE